MGRPLGAVDYIFQPLDPAILRAKVAVFVELFKTSHELRRQTAELTVAKDEIESFCYSVSHDLRAPLRNIIGLLQLLQQDCASMLDDAGQNYLSAISKTSRKMGALIDDLLSFSRMTRAALHRADVNMSELVKETMEELAQDTKGRNIDWKIDALPEVVGD